MQDGSRFAAPGITAGMQVPAPDGPVGDRKRYQGAWLHHRGWPGQRSAWAAATAAVIVRASGLTIVPATSTVGVPWTPSALARAVTYDGHSR